MRINRLNPACFVSLLLLGLSACAPMSQPPLAPTARSGQGDLTAPAPETPAISQPTGTLTLTIKWPERPDYAVQTIPLRTNALIIQVMDASNSIVADSTVSRPNGGALVTTTNLTVPAGVNQRITVKAYTEQTPGFDSVPIAVGSALGVTIEPSTQRSVRIALVPTSGPLVTSIPANAGPLAYVTIKGQNFDGWGSEVKVYFGGVLSPYVTGSGTQLVAQVPGNAPNGMISVVADGVTGTSTESCLIIRALTLTPDGATTSVGSPLDFGMTARDASGSLIPDPNVNWSYMSTGTAALPGSSPPPPTTLVNGRFTPGSTGSYEIRLNAGSVWATASVTVE